MFISQFKPICFQNELQQWKVCFNMDRVTSPSYTIQWRHNERDGVSNHRRFDCLFNCLFRWRSKKASKLHVTGLCQGNPPVAGRFPSQRSSSAKMFLFDDVIVYTKLQTYFPSIVIDWTECMFNPRKCSCIAYTAFHWKLLSLYSVGAHLTYACDKHQRGNKATARCWNINSVPYCVSFKDIVLHLISTWNISLNLTKINMRWYFIIIPPASTKLKGGFTGITLSVCPSVRPSVCGQNRVRSVSSTIFIGSISYLHFLSSNFRRCVACNARFKIIKIDFFAIFFKICNFDFVYFWLWIQYDSMVWAIMRRCVCVCVCGGGGGGGVSSERRRSSCSSSYWLCHVDFLVFAGFLVCRASGKSLELAPKPGLKSP